MLAFVTWLLLTHLKFNVFFWGYWIKIISPLLSFAFNMLSVIILLTTVKSWYNAPRYTAKCDIHITRWASKCIFSLFCIFYIARFANNITAFCGSKDSVITRFDSTWLCFVWFLIYRFSHLQLQNTQNCSFCCYYCELLQNMYIYNLFISELVPSYCRKRGFLNCYWIRMVSLCTVEVLLQWTCTETVDYSTHDVNQWTPNSSQIK